MRQVVEDLCADRLAIIISEPGLGATSLLTGLVAPALQAHGAITAIVSEWQTRFFATDLKEKIAQSVREQAESNFFAQSESLDEMLTRVRSRVGRPVALLLDRFEDYLRCHRGNDVSDFFDAELSHAIANRNGTIAIALHADAIDAFERLSPLVPNLWGHVITLGPLSREAATECLQAHDLTLEEGVAEALVTAPAAQYKGGVHPYFLAQAMKRLVEAEKRSKSSVARMGTIQAHGGPNRLILEALDSQIGELSPNHRELLFRWCNVLISPDRHRLSVTEARLVEFAGKFNRFAQTLIPKLLAMEVLRTIELQGGVRFEIANDCLVPILRDWWERQEAVLVARRRAQFRLRSISVATGSIVAVYIVWLLMTWKG